MLHQEVIKVLKPLNKYRNIVVVVSVINILAQLLPPYLMGFLIDTIYPHTDEYTTYFFIIGTIVGVLIICFFINWLQRYLWADLINNGAGLVRSFFFERVLHKNYNFFIENHVGDINNKIINDSYIYVQSKMVMQPTIILNILQIIVVFIFLFILNPYMKITTLVLCLLLFVVYSFINKYLRKASIREREAFSFLMDDANETLLGINTIQLYQVEEFFSHNFEKSVEKYEKRLSRLKFWQSLSKSATYTINNIIPVVAIFAGILYLIGGGGITIGTIVSFYYLLPRLKEPIKALTDFNIDIQNAKAVESRLEELLVKEANEVDGLEEIEKIDTLEFSNFGYAYPNGETVLNNVSKKISRGMCLAITGQSGTGKTTILRLLKRQMSPTLGELKVNGKDYLQLNRKSYLSRVAILTQDVFVFNATIYENIRFGNNVQEKTIRDAAILSGIDHFSMDENAFALSGGERHRLGLARALACDYDVLILDEPTSGLDIGTEAKIIKNLKEILEKKNCIMIVTTHSENIVKNLCNDELSLDKL